MWVILGGPKRSSELVARGPFSPVRELGHQGTLCAGRSGPGDGGPGLVSRRWEVVTPAVHTSRFLIMEWRPTVENIDPLNTLAERAEMAIRGATGDATTAVGGPRWLRVAVATDSGGEAVMKCPLPATADDRWVETLTRSARRFAADSVERLALSESAVVTITASTGFLRQSGALRTVIDVGRWTEEHAEAVVKSLFLPVTASS